MYIDFYGVHKKDGTVISFSISMWDYNEGEPTAGDIRQVNLLVENALYGICKGDYTKKPLELGSYLIYVKNFSVISLKTR